MSIKFGYSVLVYIFVFCLGSFAELYEGDKCSLQDGSKGKCKLIKECPTAMQLIKTGVNPIICGFEKIEPIVCCKDGEEVINTTNTTTMTDGISNSRKPGDISRQKCKEYAEYAYEKIQAPTLLLNPHFTKKLVCDIQRNKLVVGSTLASRREFPHMALIGYQDNDVVIWQCGGSLISENFILTAAHCMFSSLVGPAKFVRLGFTNKTDPSHMQERTVSQLIPYPEYHHPSKYHDIGLLRLSKKVLFNTYVRPACLHTQRYIPYDLAISSGWGVVSYGGEPSNDLLATVLEFFSADKCNETYSQQISTRILKDGIVDDLMICAGSTRAVRTTCQGDSGGPLQVYHTETEEVKCMYDVVGVISFGKPCGLTKDNPDVFTRVSTYIKWIEDTVWPN